MFQLRHLRTFLAAAETLSFTRAAERVHLSQPSVTGQIQALEDSIGRPLFQRANNRLTLTEAGRNLADRARVLLALADEALTAVRGDPAGHTGSIAVAAPQTLCATLLAPAAARYAGRHPEVEIAIHAWNSAQTRHAVRERHVDLGVVHGWPSATEPQLEVEVLSRDMPMVLLPTGHALASHARVAVRQLASEPLLLTPAGCRYREYVEALLQQAHARPRLRAQADGVPSLVEMVAAGAGVSVLPAKKVDLAGATSRIEMRPLAEGGDGLPICAIRVAGAGVRAHVADFLELLRDAARASDEPMAAVDVQHDPGRVAVA